jgi:hypothetical protein
MRTDLNELREIVMDEFSTDYGGGNIGLTPAGESLIALIDAELARPTDDDVESAIEELESACLCFDRHENCGGCPIEDRCWGKGKLKQAKEIIKTALRAYRKPTPDEATEIDQAIAELSRWTHYHHGFELDVAGYVPPDPEVGVTAKTFETIATALRRMKG